MEEETYKCLGRTSFAVLDYTEKQVRKCLKYSLGLCESGGACTARIGLNNSKRIRDLDSL